MPPFATSGFDLPGHLVQIFDEHGNLLYQGRTELTGQALQDWANNLASERQLANQGLAALLGGNNPYSPAGSGSSSMSDYLKGAAGRALQFEKDSLAGGDAPPPPPEYDPNYRFNQYIDFPNWNVTQIGGFKGSKLARNQDPCNDSQQAIQNSYIPARNGDPATDQSTQFGSAYNQQQSAGLASERVLADILNISDPQDYLGSDVQTAFTNAVDSLSSDQWSDPEALADAIVNNVLGLNNLPNFGPIGPGSLSPALISVLDQIAQEIHSGNEGDIDWSALGDYLAAQADAAAAGLQANQLGNGSSPCSDINSPVNDANKNQFNNQNAANNALKKFDKNIKPPAGGGSTNCDNINATDPTGDADQIPDFASPPYATGLRQDILKAAEKYGINPLLLYGIGMQESKMGQDAHFKKTGGIGWDGSGMGIWQIDSYYGTQPPLNLTSAQIQQCRTDPAFCAMQAAKLIAANLKTYKGDVKKAIMAYNGTPGTTTTQAYLKKVCNYLKNANPSGGGSPSGSLGGQKDSINPSGNNSGALSLLPDFTSSFIGSGPAISFNSVSLLPDISTMA